MNISSKFEVEYEPYLYHRTIQEMNPADRIIELTEKLNYYNERYYTDSVSEISDQEFDFLLKELESLETEFPELKQPDSPSHRVGGAITKSFANDSIG